MTAQLKSWENRDGAMSAQLKSWENWGDLARRGQISQKRPGAKSLIKSFVKCCAKHASASPGTVFEVSGESSQRRMFLYVSLHKCKDVCASALPCRDCEGKVILSKKNHHQDRSVTENCPNDRVKWYYDKKNVKFDPI